MPERRSPLVVAASIVLAAAIALPVRPAGAAALVVRNVTLIDGTSALPLAGAAVLVVDGRIAAVGEEAELPLPEGAEILDGGGGFLLPGFIDSHAHLGLGPVRLDTSGAAPLLRADPDPEVGPRSLATLLAAGVTTARDPGGPAAVTTGLRDAVARGEVPGPRLLVAGEVIDTSVFPGLCTTVATADDVRAEVRRQAAAGVDMVKLYAGLRPELVATGIEEAHAQGLPAIGHLMATSWSEAARLGLDGLLHIAPGSGDLLAPERRAEYARRNVGTLGFIAWFELVDLDGPEIAELLATLAAAQVPVDPTLALFEAMFHGDDPRFAGATPGLELAAPALRENWESFFQMTVGWSAADFAAARAVWPKVLRFARMLYDHGIPLSAGTDANNPFIVPGPSFHRELELLAAAGIPPLAVLRIATAGGANALGLAAEVGSIEPGKRADLILLAGDPVADIRHSREVVWVLQGGRRIFPQELIRSLVP